MAPRFCPRSDLELRAGGLEWRLARWHQARRHEGLKYASSFPSQPPSLATRDAPANVLHLATDLENIAERYLIQNTTPLYLKSVLPCFINEDLRTSKAGAGRGLPARAPTATSTYGRPPPSPPSPPSSSPSCFQRLLQSSITSISGCLAASYFYLWQFLNILRWFLWIFLGKFSFLYLMRSVGT